MMSKRGRPCGACKFMKRKCESGCVFAPHFHSGDGAANFAAVNKIFGCSNVSKLLKGIPEMKRGEAVVTIIYEAQARIKDLFYGCAAHVYALQQQIQSLQTEVAWMKAQLAKLATVSMVPESYNNGNNYFLTSTALSAPYSSSPYLYEPSVSQMIASQLSVLSGASSVPCIDRLHSDRNAVSSNTPATGCNDLIIEPPDIISTQQIEVVTRENAFVEIYQMTNNVIADKSAGKSFQP